MPGARKADGLCCGCGFGSLRLGEPVGGTEFRAHTGEDVPAWMTEPPDPSA